ncbi:MAG: T9SS C-terminal target domain-containing protein [Bacteroidetes bacterium]|nr:MAG: T9SS C-terminal target domain-containing protein [Bacteroidota bacterium]
MQTYIAFRPQDTRSPAFVGKVANQNLHALLPPDALFICPPIFEAEAKRLAQFRQTNDGLTVEVVNTQRIYNEFSSGRQDITALRDFVRSLYLKNPTKFKHVLLFGDGSFDYKNRIPNNTNFVPIYESRESLQPIFSHSSDDYFGLLQLNEGEWEEVQDAPQSLEVGIGRLPVKNTTEARWIVDKLIAYSSQRERLGEWRNDIIFVADDGDSNAHQQHAEQLAEWLENNAPATRSKKLYMDIFEQISTPSGERCPDVTNGLQEAIRNGGLIVNYAGHGSESVWAQEKLLENEQIPTWRNRYRLPLFITATCEFGRYDNPYEVSGAEKILLDVQGGGIGLITTTRPVFSSTNLLLNQAFYESAFPANGAPMPRLGDIIRYTKNHSNTGVINRNFALLGDPTMRLAYPTRQAVLTNLPTEIKALQPVTLEGEIQENNALVSNFNGVITVTVFDKRRTLQTRGTESQKMDYKMRDIVLFKGQARVVNGRFAINFIAPKDIRYNFGTGKVQLYAQHDTENTDASGANSTIVVGGSYTSPATDNTPPKITLYMDSPAFVSGGEVSRESTFWAVLEDESGINISQASLGHEIVAIIDNQVDKPIILNDYFMAEIGTYKKGKLAYLLSGLQAGKHNIRLKVWDIHNNSNEASIEFIVRDKTPINITESVVFPNPNSGKPFNFCFRHDQTDNELQATLEIYDAQGRFVQRITGKDFYATETITFEWKPSPTLSAGTYIYKLSLYSPQTFAVGSLVGKLVIDF